MVEVGETDAPVDRDAVLVEVGETDAPVVWVAVLVEVAETDAPVDRDAVVVEVTDASTFIDVEGDALIGRVVVLGDADGEVDEPRIDTVTNGSNEVNAGNREAVE